ncbi:MAG: hypothetical protein ACKO3G_14050 [Planctomycetaceae bacterium]
MTRTIPAPAPRRTLHAVLLAVGALVVVDAAAAPARAQWGGGWGGWGMGGGYASTAGQAAAYGMSDIIRSEGYANLQNSEAAKNWEDAKSKDIQNRQQWTDAFFDMRRTNREARKAEAGPAVTRDQAIRFAKSAAPPRLTSAQLDPVTGHIEYPMVLTDTIYDPFRRDLDKLFADRAATGGSLQFEEFQKIQGTVSKFIEALKQNVSRYPAGDYGRARTFLNSLANEPRYPAG